MRLMDECSASAMERVMRAERTSLNPLRRWRYTLPERSIEELKGHCRILFIDDQDFSVPEILVTSGWKRTKRITDVDSLACPDVEDSHIVFVDITGVGVKLGFSEQGLGLVSALKEKYPQKRVVVYSAQSVGDRFHRGLSEADERLAKNADPFEFETLVERFAREMWSVEGIVERLKEVLGTEFGHHLSEEQIHAMLVRVGRRGDWSSPTVAKVFKIANAGSIASIIQLFMGG